MNHPSFVFPHNLPQTHKFTKQFLRFNNLNPQYFLKTNPKIIHKLSISQLVLSYINPDDLRKLIQSLKNIKFLHTLKLRLSECNARDLKKVTNQLRTIKGVQSLKIELFDFQEDDVKELIDLPIKTAHGRKLRELDVDFSSRTVLPQSLGRLTSLFLKTQSRLDTLSLKFQPLEAFSNNDLVLLSKQLQKRGSSLRNLKLDFIKCDDVDLNGLYELTSRGLRNLPNLKNFSLNLKHSCPPDFEDGSMIDLNLFKTKNLAHLDLNFLGWESISGKDFELLENQFKNWSLSLKSLTVKLPLGDLNIFTESLDYLKNLKSFRFVMGPPEDQEGLSLEVIQSLAKGLERLKELEKLDLKLKNQNLQDKDIVALLKGIQSKNSLKSLTLNLWSENENTAEGLKEIFRRLKELEGLEDLDLDLGGCETKSSNVKILAGSIEKLKELKRCKVCLDKLENNGADFSLLLASLGTLPKLSTLEFPVFSGKITGPDLLLFSNDLKKMKSLQRLGLFFDCDAGSIFWCEGFEMFFERLKEIPTLTDLSIEMDNANNKALEILFKQLKGWRNLNLLKLGFSNGGFIDNKTTEEFYQAMKTLRGLRNFAMHFYHRILIQTGPASQLLKGIDELKYVENLEFSMSNLKYQEDSGENWIKAKMRLLAKLVTMRGLKKCRFMGDHIM